MPMRENSSIPLPSGLGSGNNTKAEPHAPGVGGRKTSSFCCTRQKDETPCPSNSKGAASATTTTNIHWLS